ncbi:MAG TPA: hypothetical protein VMT54_16345 [Candidatus Cybelea sp.]|nr:hypothetical protein [Candidatus Cybelea sp.]
MTVVERLVNAGIIDDTYLTDAGKNLLNGVTISDAEIASLASMQQRLLLEPLQPQDPIDRGGGVLIMGRL